MPGYEFRLEPICFAYSKERPVPATVLVGAQWGDEGKGKLTDLLAETADMVVRYQGGNNAGHTIVPDESAAGILKLHLVPSGIRHPECIPVIGNGVVIDPEVLFVEIDELEVAGIRTDQMKISANAHLIMAYHKVLDRVTERHLGGNRVGTTRRGIGPCYADKASRIGLRVQDLFDEKIFRQKVEANLKEKNQVLAKVYNQLPVDADEVARDCLAYADRFAPMVCDASALVDKALDQGRSVIFEGAQGALLDLDHGTYPFVTSSNPIAGGASTGAGIAPARIDRVIGVAKAYLTRVGAGPFPSEDTGETGMALIEGGGEFGTTTGRQRRCGWFDTILLRYANRLNGFTELFLTKLDVLSQFETLKVCTSYEINGEITDEMPYHQTDFHHARPVYTDLPGWQRDISDANKLSDLPSEARAYVAFLEESAGIPITTISVGPARSQTLEAAA